MAEAKTEAGFKPRPSTLTGPNHRSEFLLRIPGRGEFPLDYPANIRSYCRNNFFFEMWTMRKTCKTGITDANRSILVGVNRSGNKPPINYIFLF
jgi:hypothetical protein